MIAASTVAKGSLLAAGLGLEALAASGWFDKMVGPLIALGIGSLGTWFWFVRGGKQRANDKLLAEVADLKSRMAMVDKIVEPLWTAAQKKLVDELTHFHTPELDALLVKLTNGTLTEEDTARMALLLEERVTTLNGTIDASERDAARILPAVIRKARAEAADVGDPNTASPSFQVVSVAPPIESPSQEAP